VLASVSEISQRGDVTVVFNEQINTIEDTEALAADMTLKLYNSEEDRRSLIDNWGITGVSNWQLLIRVNFTDFTKVSANEVTYHFYHKG